MHTSRDIIVLFLATSLSFSLSSPTAVAQTVTAQTDLASIAVTPLAHKTASADWQTVYDYSGGPLPPGSKIEADGKWIDPPTRASANGFTFTLPALPDQPGAAQFLRARFSVDQPIEAYPTRITVTFAEPFDGVATAPTLSRWSALAVLTPRPSLERLFDVYGNQPDVPFKATGLNTLVFALDPSGKQTVTLNGTDITASAFRRRAPILAKAGSILLPGFAVEAAMIELAQDKGDWLTISQLKIEQMRPPIEDTVSAAVDLTVPGANPVRVSIEAVNGKDDTQGFVLHDAVVQPGKYRLYWNGIDQVTGQPTGATVAPAGAYSFHLTTSKVKVTEVGEPNNAAPRFSYESDAQILCSSLTMTPPDTPVPVRTLGGFEFNPRVDTRKLDSSDSVQLDCVGYDAHYGEWIAANGSPIHTKTGDPGMQYGRDIALTPPDPGAPNDPTRQFYFTSMSIREPGVMTCSLPAEGKPVGKLFTSPDWNRKADWVPYCVQIGKVPDWRGPQKYVFFEVSPGPSGYRGEWIIRNLRIYENGATPPSPVTFDPTQFSVRMLPKMFGAKVTPGSVTVEDDGVSVHLKDSQSLNYPYTCTVTPNTIMTFDVKLIDDSKMGGQGNGIGLDSQPTLLKPVGYDQFIDLFSHDPRWGLHDASLGARTYPQYSPNTLYPDTYYDPPNVPDAKFLFARGYYGLRISEDGKLLFACNNADNRLEVRNIAGDGSAVAEIPIDMPMFVALAPTGAAGAPPGSRYVFVDSATAGVVRIAWHIADNTFGKPETLTAASLFAYPRGIVYDAAVQRLFVCDAFNPDRSRVANQIDVIDPVSGKVLSRFGKPDGADVDSGELIDESDFSCPLTIDADSKGALWVNDYFSGEVRKYAYNPATGGFELLHRVFGSNTTNVSHFYWTPGSLPTTVWTVGDFLIRHQFDVGPDGWAINQHATAADTDIMKEPLRPYAHFTLFNGRTFATFGSDTNTVYELVDNRWLPRYAVGRNAGEAARAYGLLATGGAPPTDLDKAIAASGDTDWETRYWTWSDLDGDGKVSYSAANPEFKIAFNTDLAASSSIPPSGSMRASDGAFLIPATKGGRRGDPGIAVIVPKTVNGALSYDWADAKFMPVAPGEPVMDVYAGGDRDDGNRSDGDRYYVLRQSGFRHDVGADKVGDIEAYDATGDLLWSRCRTDYTDVSIDSLGPGLIGVFDRSWSDGPESILDEHGNLVAQVFCKEAGDCWSPGLLRVDADTAMVGIVQAYKVTGLSSARSAETAPLTVAAGG